MGKLLFIAYHFPPIRHSSGVQRTLNFVRDLRNHGWESMVLTVMPMAYPLVGDDLMGDVPSTTRVERTFAFDAARHLSILGRYPRFVADPDRWGTWQYSAVRAGMRLIERHRPDVIISTYPIATAHHIGLILHKKTGLPWVADFRDSMVDESYPDDPVTRSRYQEIELDVVGNCQRAVFTTEGTRAMYADRHPDIPAGRWTVISNGYNEALFTEIESEQPARPKVTQRLLLHSGLLYPSERDPIPFFQALRALKSAGKIDRENLCVRLRATGYEDHYRPILRNLGLEDIVDLAAALPYREACAEMLRADALLLFQAASCNHQVPAKLYEYLRAQRPIIALIDGGGETAAILRKCHADNLLPIDDMPALAKGFRFLLNTGGFGGLNLVSMGQAKSYSRQHQARVLADLLAELA